MTEESQDTTKQSVADAISIGIVEKAWELKWGIQLVYVALYADAVLACVLHRNLLSVTSNSSQIWESIGALLIGVAGFCLTVSLIIPIIAGLLKTAIIDLAPIVVMNAFREHSAHRDEISPHYLHSEALKTKDEFLMAIYREQRPSARTKSAEHRQVGMLICGLVLLIIADIWAGYASGTTTLLLLLAQGNELAFYFTLVPTLVVLLIWASLRPYPRDNVYHPTLRKQQDEERAALYSRGDGRPQR